MKTKTTYEASLEIPVPAEMLVYVSTKQRSSDEMEAGQLLSTVLIFSATSSVDMAEAKTIIARFVNEVLAAERENEEVEL